MAQIKKAVDIAEAGVTTKGDVYWQITWDDQKKQNIFSEEYYKTILESIEHDLPVEVKFVKSGKYYNVEGITLLDKGAKPDEKTTERPETKPATKSPYERPDNSASIESQVAVKAVIELWVAGKITDKDQLALTAKSWIMSKLSNWASMGDINPLPQPTKSTTSPSKVDASDNLSPKERAILAALWREQGYTDELAQVIIARKYNVSSTGKLNKKQLAELTKIFSDKQYLNETPDKLDEIEPEEFPF